MPGDDKPLAACGKCEYRLEIRISRVLESVNQFCSAHPHPNQFNFFSGEFEPPAAAGMKYRPCADININGHCPKYTERGEQAAPLEEKK